MKTILFAVTLLLVGCGATVKEQNECATPVNVVSCEDEVFFTFELVSVDDAGQPTWLGSQCDTHPCHPGDSCEARDLNGNFAEGVCE